MTEVTREVRRIIEAALRTDVSRAGSLAAVCRAWSRAVEDFLHPAVPGLVTTVELRALKLRARALPLAHLQSEWLLECKEDSVLGRLHTVGAPSTLELLLEHFGGEAELFAGVRREYRRFLVLKALEAKACAAAISFAPEAWRQRARPTKIVDMLWHAHMLRPVEYARSCNELAGQLLDHDAGYLHPDPVPGSTLGDKLNQIFGRETRADGARGPWRLSAFSSARWREDLGGAALAE